MAKVYPNKARIPSHRLACLGYRFPNPRVWRSFAPFWPPSR